MLNRSKWIAVAVLAIVATASQSRAAIVTAFDDLPGTGSSLIGYAAGSVFGDTLSLVKTGTLDSMTYSVWNGGTGLISGVTVTLHFYVDTGTGTRFGTDLGSFSQTLAFTTALATGNYGLGQATNLGLLLSPIIFNASNIVVTQQFSGLVATSGAVPGVIFNSMVATGSDPTPTQHHVVNGSNSGFIDFNPSATYAQVFQVAVAVPEPGSVVTLGIVSVIAMRRRR